MFDTTASGLRDLTDSPPPNSSAGKEEGKGVNKEEEKEQRLFFLAKQTEALFLVFLSFSRAGLCRRRGDGGRHRLRSSGLGRRAVAAGRDLWLVA